MKKKAGIKKNNNIPNSQEQFNLEDFIKNYYAIFITLTILIGSTVGYYSEYNLLKQFNINLLSYVEIDDFFLAALKYPTVFILSFLSIAIILNILSYIFKLIKRKRNLQIALEKIDKSSITAGNENTEDLIKKSQKLHETVKQKIIERQELNFFTRNFLNFYEFILGTGLNELLRTSQDNVVRGYRLANVIVKEKVIKKSINKSLIRIILFLILSAMCMFLYVHLVYSILERNLQRQLDRIINNPSSMATVYLKDNMSLPNDLNQPLVFIIATSKFMFFYQHGTAEKSSVYALPISSVINVHYSDFKKINNP